MPEFTYAGVDKAGKKISGKIEAPSEGEVRMILRGQGVRPTRIVKGAGLNMDLGAMLKGGSSRVSLELLVIFTRQLQTLMATLCPMPGPSTTLLSRLTVCRGLIGAGTLRESMWSVVS